jgi:hypothetical protein
MRSMAGSGRGWGAGLAHRSSNHVHHAFDISKYIVIPESQHSITACLKIGGPFRITCQAERFIVLPAIEFDHKPGSVARKVSEVRSDRRLPPKMRAVDLDTAQMLPQRRLGIGRLTPHRAGAWHTAVTVSFARGLLQVPSTPDPSPPLRGREGSRAPSRGLGIDVQPTLPI